MVKRLLLVEDHHDTAKIIARVLGRQGYEVATAYSVAEADALCRANRFDLLISDISLPDGTGHALLERLGEHRPLRAIALTARGYERDKAQSIESGFLYHLVKPILIDALLATVEAALERAVKGEPESGGFPKEMGSS